MLIITRIYFFAKPDTEPGLIQAVSSTSKTKQIHVVLGLFWKWSLMLPEIKLAKSYWQTVSTSPNKLLTIAVTSVTIYLCFLRRKRRTAWQNNFSKQMAHILILGVWKCQARILVVNVGLACEVGVSTSWQSTAQKTKMRAVVRRSWGGRQDSGNSLLPSDCQFLLLSVPVNARSKIEIT